MAFKYFKPVEIDFEFNDTSERLLNLVCCSLRVVNAGEEIERYWLHKNAGEQLRLKERLLELKADHTFLAFGASAEARSFIALGLQPLDFMWIDLYAEWRMARYNNNRFEYGRYLIKDKSPSGRLIKCEIGYSVAPSFDKRENKGKNNTPTGMGMADCVANMFGIKVDTIHKEQMRDLIISQPDDFTPEESIAIMDYCDSDLFHLSKMLDKFANNINKLTKHKFDRYEIVDMMTTRGQYSAAVAHFETVGIPQDMEMITNLSRNNWGAINDLVELNQKFYKFYAKERKTKKDLKGHWVFKKAQFHQFLKDKNMFKDWPRNEITDNEKIKAKDNDRVPVASLKTDAETLDDFKFVPELEGLRQTMKSIQNLTWFRPSAFLDPKKGFKKSVGSDDRLRTFYGPYGTQTGRNAPPASRYTFAMANWLRCTIRAPKGMSITGVDYKSQEFLVAGLMSGDKNMIEAYRTGDPYLAFAKMAGAIPPDGTKEEYPEIRALFKICALAMLYGMGRDALFTRVKASKGDALKSETDKLYDNHKRLFSRFWNWADNFIVDEYKYQEHLILPDGWLLGPHCESITSVKNWPVQGMGGCIMRRAAVNAVKHGLDIISPLHDAIYILHKDEDRRAKKDLCNIMYDACESFLPGADIGLDIETHDHDHIWVEDRSIDYYEAMKKYLVHRETDYDISKRVKDKVYGY